MVRTRAVENKDFARKLLRLVEHLGRDGRRVSWQEALRKAQAACPDHACTRRLREKPARGGSLARVVERLRRAEFSHIERQKDGRRRNAPVAFRVHQPGRELTPAAAGSQAGWGASWMPHVQAALGHAVEAAPVAALAGRDASSAPMPPPAYQAQAPREPLAPTHFPSSVVQASGTALPANLASPPSSTTRPIWRAVRERWRLEPAATRRYGPGMTDLPATGRLVMAAQQALRRVRRWLSGVMTRLRPDAGPASYR